jgi:hypothetical protein
MSVEAVWWAETTLSPSGPNSLERSLAKATPAASGSHSPHANNYSSSSSDSRKSTTVCWRTPRPAGKHASDLDFREFFTDYNVEAVSKVKWPSRDVMQDQCRYAIVELESAEEAKRAIEQMNGINR